LAISIASSPQIEREKRRLDIVFANAGVAAYAPFGKITEEHYDSMLRHQRERPLVHGAEGASPDGGWCLDHPERVHRRQ
jgi:hypothetical protein